MAYTTLDNVKIKLGIPSTDTSMDDTINYYITRTTAIMNNILWCDLSTQWTKTQDFDLCDLKYDCYDAVLDMKCANVKSVDVIDWEVYTWILGTDYKVTWYLGNTVLVHDFKNTLTISNSEFCVFTVEYTAWYATIPDDLSFAQDCLVEWYISQKQGRDVITERSWPRTITFATKADSQEFMNILSFYTPLRLHA